MVKKLAVVLAAAMVTTPGVSVVGQMERVVHATRAWR